MLKKIIILVFVTCFACFNTVFAAESGGMPQLNPEFWISQIFWLIITFGILFIVRTKVILPKISNNLETRKSQILENIETADKQKEESQKKIDEYEKIILDSKIKAKNYFNEAREKILEDLNKKKVIACGNIGLPIGDVIKKSCSNDIFVIEASSFQLDKIFSLKFDI